MLNGVSILNAIHKCGGRITGSYARLEEHAVSDLDFRMSFGQFTKLKKMLNGLPFESCITGHIAYQSDLGMIEISYLFNKQNCPVRNRVLFDLDFRTW